MLEEKQISDVEIADEMLSKEPESAEERLAKAEAEMKDWYDNEFLPYKKAKEQEKEDFETFRRVIQSHPHEVKYILSCIYDEDYDNAVTTWNHIKIKPSITAIELKEENLIITDTDDDVHEILFESLLDKINMVLGG